MTAALAVSTLPGLLLEAFPDLNAHKQLIDEISAFTAGLVSRRPAQQDEEETAALSRFMQLQLRLLDVLEARVVSALRIAHDHQLDSLILAEYGSAEVERKLALRHLQSASAVFGDMVELFTEMLEGLPPEPIAERIRQAYAATAPATAVEHPELRVFLRWLVALLVGSEAANAEGLDDVSFWAHRALTASRQVRALLAREARGLAGTRARMKAEIAWDDWDDEEIEAEKQSWPDL